MADGRMLRKKASIDRRLAQLSCRSALLYLLSIPHLDDGGRMIGLPAWVRGTVVPAFTEQQPADWTDDQVAALMHEWTCTVDPDGHPWPLVLRYTIQEHCVCFFVGFANNQKLRHDRKPTVLLPPPPPELLAEHGLALDGLRLIREHKPPPDGRIRQVRDIRAPEVELELEEGRGLPRGDTARAREAAMDPLPVAQVLEASLSSTAPVMRAAEPRRRSGVLDDVELVALRVRPDPDGNRVSVKTLVKLRRAGLPPAAFARAYEALEQRRRQQPPLRSEPRYFVSALNSMLREKQYA